MHRIIIAGSRDFQDYKLMEKEFCQFMNGEDTENITIISGGARGADRLGEHLAYEYEIDVEVYPANWDKYGKSAGYKRNEQMANVATHALIFWNISKQTPGTKHMIDLADKYKLITKVVKYETV